MNNRALHIVLIAAVVIGVAIAFVYKEKGYEPVGFEEIFQEKKQYKYGVAAAHPLAVHVGMEILEQGGNAVDAAIAVSYALGVVEPFGSGIGGGGTMLIYPPGKKDKPVVVDYREVAPYSGDFPSSGVGVPGFVKGMELAHRKYGKLPMDKLIQPAIDLAEEGFEVTPLLTGRLRDAQHRMDVGRIPQFYPGGRPIQPTQLLVQKELAATLKLIQQQGSEAFYEGKIARDIVARTDGIRLDDLKRYRATIKKPVKIRYGDYEMVTTPPPSGGVMLAESLMIADEVDVDKTKDLSADFIHLLAETQKRVNTSRIEHIGDPDFVDVPVDDLLSRDYAKKLAADIDRDHISTKYKSVVDSLADKEDHDNTTHIVVVDKNGMMVSVTNTLSNFFGSGVYVDGFFLNNQLKNFSISRSSPNCPAPGKKPISYTAPTIFAKNGQPVLGIGSAGGNRITPVLTQVIIRHLEFGMPLQTAIDEPRFIVDGNHIYVERPLDPDTMKRLERLGYTVQVKPASLFYGGVQAIRIDRKTNTIEGGFDRRRDGAFLSSD